MKQGGRKAGGGGLLGGEQSKATEPQRESAGGDRNADSTRHCPHRRVLKWPGCPVMLHGLCVRADLPHSPQSSIAHIVGEFAFRQSRGAEKRPTHATQRQTVCVNLLFLPLFHQNVHQQKE